MPTVKEELERYVRTGRTDPDHAAWADGEGGFFERATRADADLRRALVDEVRRLSHGFTPVIPRTDTVALTRKKVEPMVRGLFPRIEHDTVLATLEKSVVFVTAENIEALVRDHAWDNSAWDIANLYLGSLGAPLLGPDAVGIVGLSEDTTCFVSTDYLECDDPFSDFIVHEAAHIFHNCKRYRIGLRHTRRKEWLLDIEYRKRETFAYSCEAFARICERAKSAADRRALAAELPDAWRISEERVDPREVADIVQTAAASRSGWKVILRRCAPIPIARRGAVAIGAEP